MKIFIINTDYYSIDQFFLSNPDFSNWNYKKQYDIRMKSLIGTADFYSSNLKKIGYKAWDVVANLEPMQKHWANENGIKFEDYGWNLTFKRGFLPWIKKKKKLWLYEILRSQIHAFKPDIIYSMAIETIDSSFLESVKGSYRIAIGQHAASLNHNDISKYDIILSSLPNQIEYFEGLGLKSEYLKLGFEPRILDLIKKDKKKYDLTFIGGFGKHFQKSNELIKKLIKTFDFNLWGYSDQCESNQIITKNLNGVLYGKEMYQVLARSKIIFNRHADFAGNYANNMRLYQGTGIGSLLITDSKDNLSNIFKVGEEVVDYSSVDECVEKIDYYLNHEEERESIAKNGQKRCIDEHSWYNRMEELNQIVKKII